MNYYEHHIGDYAEATAHLSFVEDAAYSRLLRKYYATEKPIPADPKAAQRLVGARTRDERQAVQDMLEEFFELLADGWHHHRCDREIAAYLAGQPQREAKKRNEDVRLERHRAARADMFAVINDAGQHMPWNVPTAELRAAVDRIKAAQPATLPATSATAPATQPATPEVEPATLPATAPATPATATHTRAPLPTPHPPSPTPHSPLPTSHPPTNIDTHSAQPEERPPPEEQLARVTVCREAAACLAMKTEGIGDVNPGHPDLIRLVAEGVGLDTFVGAARAAVGKHKGFAYALGIVGKQHAEAQAMANGARAAPPTNGHSGSSTRAARMAEAVPGLVAKPKNGNDFIETEVRDVTPRRLG